MIDVFSHEGCIRLTRKKRTKTSKNSVVAVQKPHLVWSPVIPCNPPLNNVDSLRLNRTA